MKERMDFFMGQAWKWWCPRFLFIPLARTQLHGHVGCKRSWEMQSSVCPGSREHTDVDGEAVFQRAIQMQENITEVSEVRRDLIFILKSSFCLKMSGTVL